jgi:hypothetical protein
MNTQDRQHLIIFGLGMGIIIPYLVMVKTAHLAMTAGSLALILAGFFCLLYILSRSHLKSRLYYITLIGVYALLIKLIMVNGAGPVRIGLLAVSVFFLSAALVKVEILKPLYTLWMRLAHTIGTVISTLVLGVLFYGVFGVIGIILRIMRKDYLDRKIDKKAGSYWVKRTMSSDTKSYTKQY